MKIVGIEGISPDQLGFEIQRGAKFIVFEYCISVILMTFKRPSPIYFIRPGESRIPRILGYSAISLLLGWWGIPWGPVYTIGSLVTNFGGGKDVTKQIMDGLDGTSG